MQVFIPTKHNLVTLADAPPSLIEFEFIGEV